jgi:hypothetical protein
MAGGVWHNARRYARRRPGPTGVPKACAAPGGRAHLPSTTGARRVGLREGTPVDVWRRALHAWSAYPVGTSAPAGGCRARRVGSALTRAPTPRRPQAAVWHSTCSVTVSRPPPVQTRHDHRGNGRWQAMGVGSRRPLAARIVSCKPQRWRRGGPWAGGAHTVRDRRTGGGNRGRARDLRGTRARPAAVLLTGRHQHGDRHHPRRVSAGDG